MIARLERIGATPEEIKCLQAIPSELKRFEALADQDIREVLASLRHTEPAAEEPILETAVEQKAVEQKPVAKDKPAAA